MAQLRRDEEARSYERMINRPPAMETFSQRFPNSASASAHMFAEVNRPQRESDNGDDDVSYGDVHRQLMLLFNFMVSIVGVGATIWIVARWWSTPARIFVTMAGSILVAIAEVAVYSGYIWRLGEAKSKERKTKEKKEIVRSWVVGAEDTSSADQAISIKSKAEDIDPTLRRRAKGPT
jgi:TMEM199 family protein